MPNNTNPGIDDDTGTAGVQDYVDDNYFALQDQQFNVLALTNDTGEIVERYEYSLYGQRTIMNANYVVLAKSAFDMHCGFQGHYHDTETGLIYNRARMYSPTLGRFIHRDPHPTIYPDGMNTYAAYHVMKGGVDPSGMLKKEAPENWDQWSSSRAYLEQQIQRLPDTYSDYLFWNTFKMGTGLENILNGGVRAKYLIGGNYIVKFQNNNGAWGGANSDPSYNGYGPGGLLRIPSTGTTPEKLVHEAWHAWVDVDNLWKFRGDGQMPTADDEAIGYMLENLYGASASAMQSLEDHISTMNPNGNDLSGKDGKLVKLRDKWLSLWQSNDEFWLKGAGYQWQDWIWQEPKEGRALGSHVGLMEMHTGINVSCKNYAAKLNALPNLGKNGCRIVLHCDNAGGAYSETNNMHSGPGATDSIHIYLRKNIDSNLE